MSVGTNSAVRPQTIGGAQRRPQNRPGLKRRRKLDVTGLFGLPALAYWALFMVGPLLAVFVYSVTDASTIVSKPQFEGLGNYERIFTSGLFWDALRNTALQVIVVVPLMVVLGYMLGYLLYTRPRGARILRILFFTSALLSAPAKAMVFYSVLSPNGLLNQMLGWIGLEDLQTVWLANRFTALPVIMAIDLWSGVGFLAVLFSAQLTSISSEVIEAARLDGAGDWRSMWHIAFGMIRGFVGVVAMLQFLWTLFGSATNVLLLTKGGPGTASMTLSYVVYLKAFEQSDIGFSQAVGVVLFITGLLGVITIRSILRSRV